MPEKQHRRQYLKQVGAASSTIALGSIAGCTSGGDGGDGGADTTTAGATTTTSSGGGSAEHELVIGSVFGPGHVANEWTNEWGQFINEETDGRVSITVEPSAGGSTEIVEQTQIGAFDGNLEGVLPIIMYDPKRLWTQSPFILKEFDQVARAYDSEYFEPARQAFEEKGNQKLVGGTMYRGYRLLTGNEAYENPGDVEGISMRVPELESWLRTWRDGFGVNPTAVSADEIYSSLEQGIVEAQENPAASIRAFGLNEVQDYVMMTQHQSATVWFLFNLDSWNALREDDQETIESSLNEQIPNEYNPRAREAEQEVLTWLEENGMEIVEVDRDQWWEQAQPTVQTLFEEDVFEPSYEEVLNI